MTEKIKMSKQQQIEIESLIAELTDEAKRVVKDYIESPSENSGSIIEVHENSPVLEEDDPATKDRKRRGR